MQPPTQAPPSPAPEEMLALQARAATLAQRVINQVGDEQMGDPTPCAEWDVRALLGHMVGGNRMVATIVGGGEMEMATPAEVLLGDDPRAAFAESAAAADAALRAEGALGRLHRMPFGEVPGAMVAGMRFVDILIHTWDLAKATGQSTTLDPEVCQTGLMLARMRLGEAPRPPGSRIGPEVVVAADAPVCDRFAAYLGRQP